METKYKVFGLNSEIHQYMAVVLPIIDVFIISFIAYHSENIWISTPLNICFPLLGVLCVKATEKYNLPIFYHIFFSLGAINFVALYFFAGESSAVWIQALPIITAMFFMFKDLIVKIFYVLLYLIGIVFISFYINISSHTIFINVLTIIIFSVLIERIFSFLIQQQKNLETQKITIQKQHKRISDNINYAKRLQTAILPSEVYWNTHLIDNFILYKPKDIVSGDFYWMEKVDTTILFAAADCTGHGVSGAMVSIVCANALNRTVKEFGITEPEKILDKTRELVLETFAKGESDIKDGMDISLCSINTETKELIWAGANNPLWHISANTLNEIKGSKQPIGKTKEAKPFNSHKMKLNKGDVIYIFTDGYADQFGGQDDKKLMKKAFKEISLQIQDKPMNEQGEYLGNFIENWKIETEQTDDILVIGVKIQ